MAKRGRFLLGLVTGVVVTTAALGGLAYMFRGVIAQMNIAGTPEIPKAPQTAASQATKAAMAEAEALVAADDKKDFDFAARGFIATRSDPLIKDANGKVVFDLSSYGFLKGDAPDTANPSLWRQAKILTQHGLFKVAERIYQVRGFDVSTVSFIDAGSGWIVVALPLAMALAIASGTTGPHATIARSAPSAGGTSSPVSPSMTMSPIAGSAEATTGQPQPIASTMTSPKPS